MKNLEDKLSGSYYTPIQIVQFMKKYLAGEQKKYSKVLEPSVGDGRFVDVFEKEECIQKLVAVELVEDKVSQLESKGYSDHIEIVADDFLNFSEKTNEKYQLIIGNPPYINIKNMENDAKEKAKKICSRYQLPHSLMQNMWVAFVLASVSCLERGNHFFCTSDGISAGSIRRKDSSVFGRKI